MEQLSTFQKCMIAAGRMPAPAESTTDPKLDKPTNTMYYDNKLEGNKPMNLEDRVSAQERRQLNSDVRIEELYRDMTTGIKQLSEDMATSSKQLSEDMATGSKQLTEYLGKIEDQIEDRFNKIETDISGMKADIVTMQGDIAVLKEDMVSVKGDITSIKLTMAKNHQDTVQVLTQILERLP